MPKEDIQIKGQPLARPNVCRFTISHPVYAHGHANCASPAMAAGSPILEELFALGNIQQVMINEDSITIEKNDDTLWKELGKKVGSIIRSYAETTSPLIPEKLDTFSSLDQDEIKAKVLKVIEEQLNPTLSSHGGYIELVKLEDGIAYLRMGGGCQGCSAASLTLNNSVRRVLLSEIPEIKKVEDVTNHQAGNNPFYSSLDQYTP